MKPKQKYRMLTKPFVPMKGDQYRLGCKCKLCIQWANIPSNFFGRILTPNHLSIEYRRPIKSKGVKIIAVNDEKKGKV